jgi:hypothetical protein
MNLGDTDAECTNVEYRWLVLVVWKIAHSAEISGPHIADPAHCRQFWGALISRSFL